MELMRKKYLSALLVASFFAGATGCSEAVWTTAAASEAVGRHSVTYVRLSEPNWMFPFELTFAVV